MERRKDNKGRVLHKGESQRGDGTYMYRYYDMHHKRKYVYAPDLDSLRRKEQDIEKDLQDGIYTEDCSLNEAFERYLKQNINLKERTKHKYETEYDRWIRNTWLGKKMARKIVRSDIVLFYKEKADSGLANGTIQCIHKYISGTLNMLYEDDIIRKNCSLNCIKPYQKQNTREALTKEQTNLFLSACEAESTGKQYLLGFKLMLLTGLRVGEMAGLTWKDVDLKNRVIDINHQFVQGDGKSRTAYHIDVPKTNEGKRKVPMSEDVYELFSELKKTTYFSAHQFGANVDGYTGFVLHTRTGLPILTARFNDYAHKIVDQYNATHEDQLPNVTCHICRHTFCTRMAELDMNPNALKKIMGHASYTTTQKVYISVEDEFVNEEFYRVMRGIG